MSTNVYRPAKDDYYLNIAKAVSECSTCYYWKTGAIIVKENGVIAGSGYSGSSKEAPNCKETGACPFERDCGHKPDGTQGECLGVHAEINAMVRSRFEDMDGATMYLYSEDRDTGEYVGFEPDSLTSKIMHNCGIKRIVTGRVSVE